MASVLTCPLQHHQIARAEQYVDHVRQQQAREATAVVESGPVKL